MINWFGIIILYTRFECGDRAILWSTVSQSKYKSTPDFLNTSIKRHCFDMMWRHVLRSHHPYVRGDGTIHEAPRRKLVEDFVNHFNEYYTKIFSTLNIICADESI